MAIYKVGEVVKDLTHDERVCILSIEQTGRGVIYEVEYEDGHDGWLKETDLSF